MRSSSFARNLIAAAGVVAAFFALGFGIGSSQSMPRNAVVLLDHRGRTYLAPPCVRDSRGYEEAIAAQAYEIGYRPEPECRDQGRYLQDGRSLSGLLLEKIGVLRPLTSRWNPDGTWNW